MSASQRLTRLDKGLYLKPDGTCQLRTSVARGSTRTVKANFPNVVTARHAQARAEAVRDADGDVVAEVRHLEAVASQATFGAALVEGGSAEVRPAKRKSRLFRELVDDLQRKRKDLVETSDHTRRRSLAKGRNTLRPSTFRNDGDIFRLHLLPAFGDMPCSDIDADAVEAFLIGQAARGYAFSYVESQLVRLRMVLGRAKTSERSDDFPWPSCAPISPKDPLRKRSDPKMWGGQPGAADPLLLLSNMQVLALGVRAALRPAIYIEGLAGLRIGEDFGLQLGDFTWRSDFLWVEVVRQMNDQNVVVLWVKADASYRRIPLPPILAEYLVAYCSIYHGCDLRAVPEELKSRQLIVNPAGRDYDGSFLPAQRSGLATDLPVIRDRVGLSYEKLGYWLDSQHLRKSLATYLLNARGILRAIDGAVDGPEPTDPEELVGHLRRRLDRSPERLAAFDGIDVSRYLGHEYDAKDDPMAASPVTLTYYNLDVNAEASLMAIARTIDRIARFEIGDELPVGPDERDELPVHFADDESWMSAAEASAVLGIARTNVTTAVQRGRLEGHMGWQADGGYRRNEHSDTRKPAHPVLFVSRTGVKELARIKAMPSSKDVARRLGMSAEAFCRNFVATGRLRHEETPSVLRIDADDADELVAEIHQAVLGCFRPGEQLSREELMRRFNERCGELFVEGRALRRWVEHWVSELLAAGQLQDRGNRVGVTRRSRRAA